MIKWSFLFCLILGLFFFTAHQPLSAKQGCLSCHQGIESPGPNHRFPCQRCHGGNPDTETLDQAHQGLISNPSAFRNVNIMPPPIRSVSTMFIRLRITSIFPEIFAPPRIAT